MFFPHTQVQLITLAGHPGEQISRSATVLICCDELLTVMDELRLFPEGVESVDWQPTRPINKWVL